MAKTITKQLHLYDFTANEVVALATSLQERGKLEAIAAVVTPLSDNPRIGEAVQERVRAKIAPQIKARQGVIAANAKSAEDHRNAVDVATRQNRPIPKAPNLVPVPEIPTISIGEQASNVTFTWVADRQILDDWLRPQIPDLPEIGKYVVVQPPYNPDVALRVRWEE